MHLVMFDIDGTLVDSTGFDGELYAAALRQVLGIRVDEDWSGYPHVTDSGLLDECLRRHGLEDPDRALRRAVERCFVESVRTYVAAHPGRVREIPGARAVFDGFRRDPAYRVAIATGGWRETALMKLAAAGFVLGDTAVATASDHPERTGIMQLAERRACAGLQPRRRTYFGDGAWDQAACRTLGWDFVAIGGRLVHSPSFPCFSDAAAIRACLGG